MLKLISTYLLTSLFSYKLLILKTKTKKNKPLYTLSQHQFYAPSTITTTKTNERCAESYGPFYNHHHLNDNKKLVPSVIATPLRQPQPHTSKITNGGFPLRSSLQSINSCLTTSSTTNLNSSSGYNGTHHLDQFLNNLIRMEQTKIWEGAKCRTFYARDNVSNFIRWSREFGVNQSVLFESDDLVLHGKQQTYFYTFKLFFVIFISNQLLLLICCREEHRKKETSCPLLKLIQSRVTVEYSSFSSCDVLLFKSSYLKTFFNLK